MAPKRKEQSLDLWLREAAGVMLRLAEDLDRDIYSEEPQSEAYDLECGCREVIDYVKNYRTECDARLAAEAEDETVELRHLQHEIV